jgi:hypothetical protein
MNLKDLLDWLLHRTVSQINQVGSKSGSSARRMAQIGTFRRVGQAVLAGVR